MKIFQRKIISNCVFLFLLCTQNAFSAHINGKLFTNLGSGPSGYPPMGSADSGESINRLLKNIFGGGNSNSVNPYQSQVNQLEVAEQRLAYQQTEANRVGQSLAQIRERQAHSEANRKQDKSSGFSQLSIQDQIKIAAQEAKRAQAEKARAPVVTAEVNEDGVNEIAARESSANAPSTEASTDANVVPTEVGTAGQSAGLEKFCFPGETLISVKDDSLQGYRSQPISSIRVGDTVVSCNLTVAGGSCELGEVRAIVTRTVNYLVKLFFDGRILRTTDNHPIYSIDRKDWVQAVDLDIGEHFLDISGNIIGLENKENEEGEFRVYNLDVQGHHNYYACGILVHNCNGLVALTTTTMNEGTQALASVMSGVMPIAIPLPSREEMEHSIQNLKALKHGDSAGVEQPTVQKTNYLRRAWDYVTRHWASSSASSDSAGERPPNMAPEEAGREGAFKAAKKANDIPVTQQPDEVLPNRDRRGKIQPGREYIFNKGKPNEVRIRDDAGGHDFGPNDPQNRGPHFNDSQGNHYDY